MYFKYICCITYKGIDSCDVMERDLDMVIDVWMYGCIDVWMYGCMDVWMYGCMYACICICIYYL